MISLRVFPLYLYNSDWIAHTSGAVQGLLATTRRLQGRRRGRGGDEDGIGAC